MNKTCKRCKTTKPIDEFYVHKHMLDGRLNFCKECVGKRIKARRAKERVAYCARDKTRNAKPHRVTARAAYRRTPRGIAVMTTSRAKWLTKNPEGRAAQIKVGNAVRSGRLVKEPCSVCGTTVNVQAHHPDYSDPLRVVWLCAKDHGVEHGWVT